MGKYEKHRSLVAIAALSLALLNTAAQATCRQALAIGLDVSGSVDQDDYRLQRDGLAAALQNKDVQAAFLAVPGAPVRIFIYEWAGTNTQNLLVRWTPVTTQAVLEDVSRTLLAAPQQKRELATAIGAAMLFGSRELTGQSDCWRLTMDLSGDGQSNVGPRPRNAQAQISERITINAIVIGSDAGGSNNEISRLTSYFRAEVIKGPQAFVEAALGFEDFEDAMVRKLLKELQTFAVGSARGRDQ